MKNVLSFVLCVAMLLSLSTAAQAKTVLPGDMTGDGNHNMLDVMAMYDGISGADTLTLSKQAATDINKDGKVNMMDILAVYNAVSGGDNALPTAVDFTAWYVDIADTPYETVYDYETVTVLKTVEEYRAFRADKGDANIPWYGSGAHRLDEEIVLKDTSKALIAVPMMQDGEYVAAVSVDGDTVYVSMATAAPYTLAVYIPTPKRTMYAMVEVAISDIEGKTVELLRYYDSDVWYGEITDSVAYGNYHYSDTYNECYGEYEVTVIDDVEDIAAFCTAQKVDDAYFSAYDEAFFERDVLIVSTCMVSEYSQEIGGASFFTAFDDRILLSIEYEKCYDPYTGFPQALKPYMCLTPMSRNVYEGQDIEIMYRCRGDACCR